MQEKPNRQEPMNGANATTASSQLSTLDNKKTQHQ